MRIIPQINKYVLQQRTIPQYYPRIRRHDSKLFIITQGRHAIGFLLITK